MVDQDTYVHRPTADPLSIQRDSVHCYRADNSISISPIFHVIIQQKAKCIIKVTKTNPLTQFSHFSHPQSLTLSLNTDRSPHHSVTTHISSSKFGREKATRSSAIITPARLFLLRSRPYASAIAVAERRARLHEVASTDFIPSGIGPETRWRKFGGSTKWFRVECPPGLWSTNDISRNSEVQDLGRIMSPAYILVGYYICKREARSSHDLITLVAQEYARCWAIVETIPDSIDRARRMC